MTSQDIDPGQALEKEDLPETLRERAASALALVIGIFVFYTSFFGAFETLIQRAQAVVLDAVVPLDILFY